MTKYDVAAIVAVNELESAEWHKLTAKQQRELFGFVVIGRKEVRFDSHNQGSVKVGRWTDGSNFSSRDYSYEEFAQAINDRMPLEAW